MPKDFKTWRGADVEAAMPPTVRATFHPHEFVHPRYEFEVDAATFNLLRELVVDAIAESGGQPADELLSLAEAIEVLED